MWRVGVSIERFEPIENRSSPPAPPFSSDSDMKTLDARESRATVRARRIEDAPRTVFATHRSAQSDKPRGDNPVSSLQVSWTHTDEGWENYDRSPIGGFFSLRPSCNTGAHGARSAGVRGAICTLGRSRS